MPGTDDFDFEVASDSLGEELGFLENDPDPAPTDPAPADPTPTDPVVKQAAPSDPAPVDPAALPPDVPKTWRKEAAAHWAALPEQVRAEITKREQDIFSGLESYKSDAQLGKGFQSAIQPHAQLLRQQNIDPVALTSGLMRAHVTLSTADEAGRIAAFQQLAQSYGIPLSSLQPPEDQLYVDPSVKDLQSKFQSIESRLQAESARTAQAEQAKLVKDIETFAADPANGYFSEVSKDMVTLLERGVATTLQDAYQKAVWTNPVTRAKEVARQAAEANAKASAEAATKAAAAKAAMAAKVSPRQRGGGAATTSGTMDDTISETLAAIKNRA
jgi:hypothetical protein